MPKFNQILSHFCLIVALITTPALASETCDLAAAVAGKAQTAFSKNKAEGLKLFIKACELCPEEAGYHYNLGEAYYQYGRLDEAAGSLARAVKINGENPRWLNNLAMVFLEQGKAEEALVHAERAVKLASNFASIQDTLARARFETGSRNDALNGLHSFMQNNDNMDLAKTYETLLDRYLVLCLDQIKAGRTEEGLAGLLALDFEPKALRAHGLSLARTGQVEEAMAAIAKAGVLFPNNKEIESAQDEIAGELAAQLYRQFQSGQTTASVQKAKILSEKYPRPAIKEAYNKLLDALLADAKTVSVPESVARRPAGAGAGAADQAEGMLAGLSAGAGAASADIDLTVDVDSNIPQGAKAGKYDIAVVIGNRDYSASGTPNVDWAERDARTMREYLAKTFGYDPKISYTPKTPARPSSTRSSAPRPTIRASYSSMSSPMNPGFLSTTWATGPRISTAARPISSRSTPTPGI